METDSFFFFFNTTTALVTFAKPVQGWCGKEAMVYQGPLMWLLEQRSSSDKEKIELTALSDYPTQGTRKETNLLPIQQDGLGGILRQ